MIDFIYYGEIAIFICLGIASIIAVAVFIERGIIIGQHTSKNTILQVQEFIKWLNKGKMKDLPEKRGSGVYEKFINFSLEHYTEGHDRLHDLMEGKMIEMRIFLESRLSILTTLGSNAPFIGLLGTVLGIIKAFHSLGTLGNTGAEVVMRSISRALMATAAGLAIAIPVVMINNLFARRIKTIMGNIEVLSKEFIASYHHQRKNKGISPKKPAKGE
jgi:biopolymer transport protein ExbB